MDPAAAAELQQFEQMAQMAMGPGSVDQATRAKAGEVLGAIGQSLKHMSTIQNVLDNSTDDVAIMAAANSLMRLVTEHWNSFASAWLRRVPASRKRARAQARAHVHGAHARRTCAACTRGVHARCTRAACARGAHARARTRSARCVRACVRATTTRGRSRPATDPFPSLPYSPRPQSSSAC